MTPEPGQQLLHYRLAEKIGEGGMGVVWRAEDTTLGRDVAIKILPADLAGDAERLARFGREARLLATLNHPNIAAIYGLHEAPSTGSGQAGLNFLAMEYVGGEDLSERIARGPLPLDDALEVAGAVGEALRSAHGNGVIHRDLKPANIRIGPEGEVKVLDFGLAKMLTGDPEGSIPGGSSALSPTVTSLGTVAGVLLGTAAYMSPEQARGKPVDKRADVWAFGCILFEMLTGRIAFPGDTITDTLASVVRADPEWERLPANTPPRVRKTLDMCMTKDPRERLHDIADAMLVLGGAFDDDAAATPVIAEPAAKGFGIREGVAWAIAALALVAAIVFGLRPRHAPPAPEPPTHFSIQLADDATLALSDKPILAFSPDGRAIALNATDPATGGTIIQLRTLDQPEPWTLHGTEGGTNPFFSPDGEHVGFFADGQMKRIARGGGSPIVLVATPNPRGGVWLPDGSIVYSPEYTSGLWRIPGTGGSPESVLEPDAARGERTFRWPTVLPDGRTVLFTVGSSDSPNNYDNASLAAVSLDDGIRHDLLDGVNMARFVAPDRLVYSRAGDLYVIGFDPVDLVLTGDPVRVKEGVGGDPSSGAGYFAMSPAGDLTYVAGAVTDALSRLVVLDREGNAAPLPITPRGFHQPRFAPDGSMIAFTVGRGSIGVGGDIWTYSFVENGIRRVTFSGEDMYPAWLPDSRRIAFVHADESTIVSKAADGGGDVEQILGEISGTLLPTSWTPDGRTLAFTRTTNRTDVYLYTVGDAEPRLFVEDASAPVISPDGRWLAYSSPSAGNAAVYVEPIEGGGKWQVSTEYAAYPRWSPDGRKLFFIRVVGARPLMEVDITAGDGFRFGMPRVVVESVARYVTSTAPVINWDTDGDRFLFVELQRDDSKLLRVEVTLDWAGQLPAVLSD